MPKKSHADALTAKAHGIRGARYGAGCLAIAFAAIVLGWAPLASGQQVVFPGAEWRTAARGLDPEVKRRVDEYVRALDTTGLMVIHQGQVVYQYGDLSLLSYLASSRKSILSMLYGPYVATGAIQLDRTLKDLGMSDVGGLLPIEERAKVVDLINARSGVYHPASYPGDSLDSAPPRGSQEPGAYWLYSNWDFNAAGAAFERMTGKHIFDALRDDLAVPIGMQDFHRDRQRKDGDLTRSQYSAYPMWLSVRDMARVGYLMLRHGRWGDRQLIPEDWVKRTTTIVTPRAQLNPPFYRELPFGYSHMWWVWENPAEPDFKGAYTSWGAHGQYITILPERDMVIAHKTIPVRREVSMSDYLHLLDRIVGKVPASEVILPVLRRDGEAAALALAEQRKAESRDEIMDATDLWAVGSALLREGNTAEAERVLGLNHRLHPNSSRTLLMLARAQAAAGDTAKAIESARKVLALDPKSTRAKVQLALLGAPCDGHTIKPFSPAQLLPVTGVYQSKDLRYVVEASGEHLRIRAYQLGTGELDDDLHAFPEDTGRYFAPEGDAIVRFTGGENQAAEAIDVTSGQETSHAERSR